MFIYCLLCFKCLNLLAYSHIYTYAINWIKCWIKVMEMVQQKVAYGLIFARLLACMFDLDFPFFPFLYIWRSRQTKTMCIKRSNRMCRFFFVIFISGINDKAHTRLDRRLQWCFIWAIAAMGHSMQHEPKQTINTKYNSTNYLDAVFCALHWAKQGNIYTEQLVGFDGTMYDAHI